MSQQFRTKDAIVSQPVLYQISIRAPQNNWFDLATYTFPLSPTMLRNERPSLSSFFDTQGPSSTQGVTRVVDTYGLAPPIFLIEGTTGWDYHATDGYIITGLQSITLLSKFLERYATLNQQQREAGNKDLYALEFYDYFLNQFWQIEPVGPQGFRQSVDRTKLVYYRFRWAAVKAVGVPIVGEIDALASTVTTSAAVAAITASETIGAMLVSYSPAGLVGSVGSLL